MTRTNRTKAMQQVQERYEKSQISYIWQAYKHPSHNKRKAFAYCLRLMRRYNGHGMKILGYKSHTFSAAFRFEDENGVDCLAYITPTQDRFFEIA